MNNKYEKQDHHKTDKWGNVIPKEKTETKHDDKKAPLNNPFAEFFKDFKIEVEK